MSRYGPTPKWKCLTGWMSSGTKAPTVITVSVVDGALGMPDEELTVSNRKSTCGQSDRNPGESQTLYPTVGPMPNRVDDGDGAPLGKLVCAQSMYAIPPMLSESMTKYWISGSMLRC